jgi:hypothetical protein
LATPAPPETPKTIVTRRNVRLNLCGSADCCSNVLATVAEFEGGLKRSRTRVGMKLSRGQRSSAGQATPRPMQETHLVQRYRAGGHTVSELFGSTRSTACRAVRRAGGRAPAFQAA